jgi:hypothetical protein
MATNGSAVGCPYTWFKSLFPVMKKKTEGVASELRVRVVRNNEVRVDVTLPANSARWLIDLIPGDVVDKILEEKIPLHEIQDDLAKMKSLHPQPIFELVEPERSVIVWLE